MLLDFLTKITLISFIGNFSVSSCAASNIATNVDATFSYSVDRKKELSELQKNLRNHGYVFIVGFGGVGKTNLARSFISKILPNEYDVIWWIDCKKEINPQLNSLIKSININFSNAQIPEDGRDALATIQKINTFIKLNKLKTLIVFDSLDSRDEIENVFVTNSHLNIIITSRIDGIYESKIKIENFSRSQSIRYLQRILPPIPVNELNKLAMELKDYPIALSQAAVYLHHNQSLSVDEYIKLYKHGLQIVWNKEEKTLAQTDLRSDSVRSTLLLSLSQLGDQNITAKKLLILLSLINNQSISLSFIKEVMAEAGEDLEHVQQELSNLINHFYIELKSNDAYKNKCFFIHEIKQQMLLAIFSQSNSDLIKEIIGSMTKVILKNLADNKDNFIIFSKNNPEYIDHIENFFGKKKLLNIEDTKEELLIKIYFLDHLLYIRRDHNKSLEIIDSISSHVDKIQNNNIRSRFYSSAGDVLSLHRISTRQFDLILSKMLNELKNQEKLDKYEIIRLHNSITQAYLLKAVPTKAKHHTERSLEIISSLESPLIQIPTYYFAAWTNIDLGNYKTALDLINRAIDLFDQVPDTAIKFYNYNYKSLILLKLERYKEARELCDLSIKKCKLYFGLYQSDTQAESLAYRAESNFFLQNYKQAIQDSDESIEIYNKFYNGSEKVLDQAYPWIIKGDCLLLIGDIVNAHQSYVHALKIFRGLESSQPSERHKNTHKKVLFTSSSMKEPNTFNSYKKSYEETFKEEFNGRFAFYHSSVYPAELIFNRQN